MPYILLDRDGVINYDSPHYIKSPDEWLPIPGSLEAIAKINKLGFRVLIITNQSGVARGLYSLETLQAIHEKFIDLLSAVGGFVDEIFFCPHHPDEHCGCRKPAIGMFEKIMAKYPVQLYDTFYVGDSVTDIEVAQKVGCKPILVLTGNGQRALESHPHFKTLPHFADLNRAIEYVIRETAK